MSVSRTMSVLLSFAPLACLLHARPADACGGCFHPAAEQGSSVVTDHRMVFKIATNETVLWDQVRYAGDPAEFAWVLPVRSGTARVELSHDEWLAALDASTRSIVSGPEVFCNAAATPTGRAPSRTARRSGGCGGPSGCAADTADEGTYDLASGGTETVTFAGSDDVQVVSQDVVGPYQSVVIHANGAEGEGVAAWLGANGFAIPDAVAPVIAAYTTEGFDFVALRLRPGQGVRAMRPIRVVTPGADVTLPLRMVAAGVGAHVGLTLWIIGEGRYETGNFPDAPVPYEQLAWDPFLGRSNLGDLERTALATNGGRAWITEAAMRTRLDVGPGTSARHPTLHAAYTSTCAGLGARSEPCDVAVTSPDAGSLEDGGDAGCVRTRLGCEGFDDLEVAARGLHADDVWVTRLRADLPASALGTDLVMRASASQAEDTPSRHTEHFTTEAFDPCNGRGRAAQPSAPAPPSDDATYEHGACGVTGAEDAGTFFVVGLGALGAILVGRRRR